MESDTLKLRETNIHTERETINTQRHTHRDTHNERETHNETDTQTHWEPHTLREIHTQLDRDTLTE